MNTIRLSALCILVVCLTSLSALAESPNTLTSASKSDSQDFSKRLSTQDAWSKFKSGVTIVDVRSPEEFSTGHISNAINIPHTEIKEKVALLGSDKSKEVVPYCKSGRRAELAHRELAALGFTHVENAGGYSDLTNLTQTAKP